MPDITRLGGSRAGMGTRSHSFSRGHEEITLCWGLNCLSTTPPRRAVPRASRKEPGAAGCQSTPCLSPRWAHHPGSVREGLHWGEGGASGHASGEQYGTGKLLTEDPLGGTKNHEVSSECRADRGGRPERQGQTCPRVTDRGQRGLAWASLLPGPWGSFPVHSLFLLHSPSYPAWRQKRLSAPRILGRHSTVPGGAPLSTFCLPDLGVSIDRCGLSPGPTAQRCWPPACHWNLVVFLLTPRPRDAPWASADVPISLCLLEPST